jgi:hypothetical protein
MKNQEPENGGPRSSSKKEGLGDEVSSLRFKRLNLASAKYFKTDVMPRTIEQLIQRPTRQNVSQSWRSPKNSAEQGTMFCPRRRKQFWDFRQRKPFGLPAFQDG